MKMRILLKSSLLACVGGLVAGCTSTTVTTQSEYDGVFSKPTQVLIYDFAVSPEEVKLDSGLGPELEELVKKNKTPRTDRERAIGRQVADALANHLVTEIQALGLPAVRAYDPPLNPRETLAIQGQFVSIDEGNQTERVLIGLSLGRTDVKTLVQVYSVKYDQRRLVDRFAVDAKSGAAPGAAETMGAGAIAGHLVVSAVVSSGAAVGTQAFVANVDADARRTAKKIANQLKGIFLAQGWILPQ